MKLSLIPLLILIIFIAGCIGQPKGIIIGGGGGGGGIVIIPPSQPYLSSVSTDKNFVKAGDTFRLQIVISNPLNITTTSQLQVQVDTDCLNVNYFNATEDVNSSTTLPIIVSIAVPTSTLYYQQPLPEKCIGNDNIVVILKDVSGNILDLKTVSITIAKS